jgi:hypothetical protein
MKRYLLFFSDGFYPAMGFNDMQGDFDTIEECHKKFNERNWNCFVEYHIYDTYDRRIIFCNDSDSALAGN